VLWLAQQVCPCPLIGILAPCRQWLVEELACFRSSCWGNEDLLHRNHSQPVSQRQTPRIPVMATTVCSCGASPHALFPGAWSHLVLTCRCQA
jgi:hypothetical protein